MNSLKTIIILLFFMLLTACATTLTDVYRSPNFTYQSIINDNIGVGGVTSTVRPLSRGQKNAYGNLLWNSIIGHYPGMRVMPPGDMVRALGPRRYQRMMHYYRQYSVMPDDIFPVLKQHILRLNYLVFARITQNSISHNRYQSHNDFQNDDNVEFRTARTLRVGLKIYNISTRQLAWSGSIKTSSGNHNSYSALHVGDDKTENVALTALNLLGQLMLDQDHSYPPPPPTADLLRDVFKRFAKALPKPQK